MGKGHEQPDSGKHNHNIILRTLYPQMIKNPIFSGFPLSCLQNTESHCKQKIDTLSVWSGPFFFFKKKGGAPREAVRRKETAVAGLGAGRTLMGTECWAPGPKPASHCVTLLCSSTKRPAPWLSRRMPHASSPQ